MWMVFGSVSGDSLFDGRACRNRHGQLGHPGRGEFVRVEFFRGTAPHLGLSGEGNMVSVGMRSTDIVFFLGWGRKEADIRLTEIVRFFFGMMECEVFLLGRGTGCGFFPVTLPVFFITGICQRRG
jgi:hypothetical protein